MRNVELSWNKYGENRVRVRRYVYHAERVIVSGSRLLSRDGKGNNKGRGISTWTPYRTREATKIAFPSRLSPPSLSRICISCSSTKLFLRNDTRCANIRTSRTYRIFPPVPISILRQILKNLSFFFSPRKTRIFQFGSKLRETEWQTLTRRKVFFDTRNSLLKLLICKRLINFFFFFVEWKLALSL